MSAVDAEVPTGAAPGQQQDEKLEGEQEDRKDTAWAQIRKRIIVVDAQIPPRVSSVLEHVAWSPVPVTRLAELLKKRSKSDSDGLFKGVPFAILITTVSLVVLISLVSTSVLVLVGLMLIPVWTFAFLTRATKDRFEITHPIVQARLLGNLVRALSACIDLENAQDISKRGEVARNIDAASARFDRIYSRLPGHRAKMYSAELKTHARAGAQAIASTTSLLFAGPEGLPDLRDRLARAILRIEADDWLSVSQLGVGGEIVQRKRLFRRVLEPPSIPLIVGALTLITAVVSVVGKMLDL